MSQLLYSDITYLIFVFDIFTAIEITKIIKHLQILDA
nr:MAG TPA: hypothetical protein [Caudoviricetes sp.]